jgi:hypothetical protein
MVFLDGAGFTGDPPGLRTIQRRPLMLTYYPMPAASA